VRTGSNYGAVNGGPQMSHAAILATDRDAVPETAIRIGRTAN
jgi:hypothetical protein